MHGSMKTELIHFTMFMCTEIGMDCAGKGFNLHKQGMIVKDSDIGRRKLLLKFIQLAIVIFYRKMASSLSRDIRYPRIVESW
ncbi:hypothetical protein DAPPUDRAFT_263169 [Daphnia pulex]|uniref:Uncharacterized protein n=1 Tax=Daphnia pulex TaxID=6669 RepID=E9HP87_DAPPU|nr:hypothetical protein DAPPUDRAFT_263169 [Daphnia pulex]|eukprot:EFX66394.1 hypothetical protein DAPPUDRAFT_263169 [Daphnia pulex]